MPVHNAPSGFPQKITDAAAAIRIAEPRSPFRPILMVPFSLLGASLGLDILDRITENPLWSEAAFWTMALGLILGFLAAPLQHRNRGLMSWIWIPAPSQRREDLLAAAVLILFSLSWLLRRGAPSNPSALAVTFAVLGVLVAILGEKILEAATPDVSRLPHRSSTPMTGAPR